jgi:hypothetical protein
MALHDFRAVDPLSILLPTNVYLALVEKLHPNVPLIKEVTASMSVEDKKTTLALANAMAVAADAVKQAIGR